jgi:hypothetical protein
VPISVPNGCCAKARSAHNKTNRRTGAPRDAGRGNRFTLPSPNARFPQAIVDVALFENARARDRTRPPLNVGESQSSTVAGEGFSLDRITSAAVCASGNDVHARWKATPSIRCCRMSSLHGGWESTGTGGRCPEKKAWPRGWHTPLALAEEKGKIAGLERRAHEARPASGDGSIYLSA